MRSSGLGDDSSPEIRVLWAGVDPVDPPGPPDSPDPPPAVLDVVCEPNIAVAARRAQTEPFDAVVVDGSDPASVSVVLAAAASNAQVRRRLVASTYTQLPELVRAVDAGLIERVLAKPVSRAQLARAVIDADPSASVIVRRALDEPSDLSASAVDERLAELVGRIVALPTVVIRPLVPQDHVPRVQLVVPIIDPLHELRRELPALLGWPLKSHGSAMGRSYRHHPLRRVLGRLSEEQEVYCLGRDRFAYVALFPWSDEPKVTVVIGFAQPDPERVAKLHAHAVAHALEFPLPTRHHHSEFSYDPDYDWVITENYVGPDRRRTSTSFINRYTFRGRRKELMPNEFSSAGTFVDIAPRWAWIMAAVFAALFLIDTAMTAYYVGGGKLGELNPVMRWALGRGPVLFWTFKSALVVVATFIVMRWHVWRPGRWLFASCVAVYAVLDAYWLLLYLSAA